MYVFAAEPFRVLVVGTKEAAPFAFKDSRGKWRGISIELWAILAEDMILQYRLEEKNLETLLEETARGDLEAGISALTITAEREKNLDFTHPYFASGLGIAVSKSQGGGWWTVAEAFFSPAFLKAVGIMALVLLSAGFLVWLFERRRNQEQFGGSALQGIGSAFWWSAVTMTTVGYGDKAPRTMGGRLIALVWMFASLAVVSGFIAGITSALTVSQMGSAINGPQDLRRWPVGTVPGTTSESHLLGMNVPYRSYQTPQNALAALSRGEVDAVVYDKPFLRYLVRKDFSGQLRVLPHILGL